MTPDEQKYYDAYFDLFLTDGWKQFMKDVQDAADGFEIRSVTDEGQLKFIQGQLGTLDKVLSWQTSIEFVYDQLTKDATEEE